MVDGEPRYPGIVVRLVGEEGDVFAILGRVRKALQRAGLSAEEVERFIREATGEDYDHLLATVARWVEVQ